MKNLLNLFLIVRIADIELPKETSLDVFILVLQESKIRSVELLAKDDDFRASLSLYLSDSLPIESDSCYRDVFFSFRKKDSYFLEI